MADMQQALNLGDDGLKPRLAPATAKAGTTALDMQVEIANEKLRFGKSLTREEAKAVTLQAILEHEETHWHKRSDIATALGVTDKKIERWKAEGAPIESHNPTAKEPLYLWLLKLYSESGPTSVTTADKSIEDELKAEELRTRRLKNDQLENRLIEEARIEARGAILRIFRILKQSLLFEVATRAAEKLNGAKTRSDREHIIRQVITTTLNEHAANAATITPEGATNDGQSANA